MTESYVFKSLLIQLISTIAALGIGDDAGFRPPTQHVPDSVLA